MDSSEDEKATELLIARVKEAAPQVHYDVKAGLARHKRLLAGQAPVPAWEKEISSRVLASPWQNWRRWWAAAGAGLSGLGLFFWLEARGAEPAASTLNVAPAHSLENVAPVLPELAPAIAPPATRAAGPNSSAAVEPRASVEELPAKGSPAPLLVGAPVQQAMEQGARALEPAPPALYARDVELSPRDSARKAPRARTRTAQGAPTAAEPSTGASVSGQAPEDAEEVKQLLRAESLLVPDPLRALQLAREGNERFRRGYMRQERTYIEVMALFALGRVGEAHAHALWFLNEFPTGPYREKVERAAAQHPSR